MPATGSRTLAQTAGGKRKGLVWDLVKDVESVIKKDGNKTSEKRWVCRLGRVRILRETLSRRPERHSGTPWGARNREEEGNPALQAHPGGRQSQASTGDVHHAPEHRREGDLGGDTNRPPARRPCSSHGERGRRIKHAGWLKAGS